MAHSGELLEDRRIGRRPGLRLLDDRQLQLLEQKLPELLGRVQIEVATGEFEDLLLDQIELSFQPRAHRSEEVLVDGDARQLHAKEDRHERHLQLRHQISERRLLQLGLELLRELPGEVDRLA